MGKFHVRTRLAGLYFSLLIAASLQAGNLTEVTFPSQTVLSDAIASGGLVRLSFDGTITLTNTIEITNDVALDAQGHSVTIDGNKSVRLFRIRPGASLSATNVIFANGFHKGASVSTEQLGNPGEGGAILNESGILVLKSCLFVSNSVIGGTGGASRFGPTSRNAAGGEARGGAILTRNGSMTLDSVQIFNSTATGGGTYGVSLDVYDPMGPSLGGAVYTSNSIVSIINSSIASNACQEVEGAYGGEAWGGGIYVASGDLELSNTWVNANAAHAFGTSRAGGYSAYGGGMVAIAGVVKISRCLITSNSVVGGYGYNGVTSGQGGAIYSTATIQLADTTLSQNRATPGSSRAPTLDGYGGAFYNSGTAQLNRCLFTGNTAFGSMSGWTLPRQGSAGYGGAIYNRGEMNVTNCTVCGNFSKGGSERGNAYGAGIFNSNGIVQVVSSTVASNSVISGDSGQNPWATFRAGANLAGNGGDFAIKNSIIASPVGSSNVCGTITDAGNNICSDDSANLSSGSSFNSTDPQLKALADNGGPTLTMALEPTSPAVDFAPIIDAPTADQRGFARPVGLGIDAGAFELQANEGTTNRVRYTLTIQTNGVGSITLLPNLPTYPQGSTVRLIASPDSAWYFLGWSGDVATNAISTEVMMVADTSITANFAALPTLPLALSTNGLGSISLDPPGGSYLSNTVVTATATAASGWRFIGWAGDATNTANPVTLKMDQAHALAAIFVQLPVIDSGLQDISAQAGSDVTFAIHAVGTAPLSCQWYFGQDKLDRLTNETARLTTVSTAMQGVYSVVVSNPYGAVTNSAYLTVVGAAVATEVTIPSQTVLSDAIASGGLVRLSFDGTITLTNTIEITNNVSLDAQNHSVTISGDNKVRLFHVSPRVTFSVTNVVLASGYHTGESVASGQNGNPGEGAAIFSENADVNLVSCILTNNSVVGGAGARGGQGRGGAVSVHGGTLKMSYVTVFGNMARGGGEVYMDSNPSGEALGGAVYITNSTADISNCTISGNTCFGQSGMPGADARGGAVLLASGDLSLFKTHLTGNTAFGGSGSPVSFQGTSACGGALAVDAGTATITLCQISSNSVRGDANSVRGGMAPFPPTVVQGGAVFSAGTVFAIDSTFACNTSAPGNSFLQPPSDGCAGAFYNAGVAVLCRCSVFSNRVEGAASVPPATKGSVGRGGGIYNTSRLYITNCTIALNVAQGGFGGGNAFGGGIFNTGGVITVVSTTFATNSSLTGTSPPYLTPSQDSVTAGANIANASGAISLRDSIVAYPGGSSNVFGIITDSGYNLCSDDSASLSSGSSFNSTDPQLKPLADNGGPTLTMALDDTSPAVDFASVIGGPTLDQRGFSRPVGSAIDAGAFELQANEGSPTNRIECALTIQTNGIGSITLLPNLPTYPQGATVRLVASPDPAWYFSGWTGDADGGSLTVDVVMTTNKSITANFLPLPQFSLSVSTNGMGSVQLDPPTGPYLSNSLVTATAAPAPGWLFLGWTGDASGTNASVTLKMDSVKTLTASFVQLPAISLGLQDISALVGSDVSFSIDAVGADPLSYQWWFGGDKLGGYTNSSIVLKNLQPSMQGLYSVTVSNPYGSVTNSARLNLNVPPSISIQPISITNIVGSSVAFNVVAVGGSPLRYTWKRNGFAITNATRFAGASSATLAITNIQSVDAADYFVVVSNSWGSVTSSVARLTVLSGSKPEITQQPVGTTNYDSASVTLSVAASGTEPLEFTWLKNSVGVTNGVQNPNATNSTLTLANVHTNDSGDYVVIVSNQWGSATSQVAVVVVKGDQSAPVVTFSGYTNMQVVATSELSMTGTVINAKNGIRSALISGETSGQTCSISWVNSEYVWKAWAYLILGTNTVKIIVADNLGNTFTNSIRLVLDVTAPKLTIANLVANQRCSNSLITVKGAASDSVGIANVFWRLNGSGWNNTMGSADLTSWSADINLSVRSNTFQVFAVDMAGNASATNSVNFTYISCTSLTLRTNGIGTITLGAKNTQLEIGRAYSVTATPGKGCLFSNWVNGAGVVLGSKPTLKFCMQSNLTLLANFVANPFTARAGNYAGLFYSTNSDGITVTDAGYFTANVTASGAFTAHIRQKGHDYPFSGQFSLDGAWQTDSIKSAPALGASLQLDLSGNQISGRITGTTWASDLRAFRNTFSLAHPAPYKGQYTLVIPGADSADLPGGYSAMAITVGAAGTVSVNGNLTDSEPVSASTFVSGDGRWPFYKSLYGNKGLVLGWLNFSATPTNNIEGTIGWIKPANTLSKVYPQGWSYFGSDVLGSTFTNTRPILGWTNGILTLEGAALPQNVSHHIHLSPTGQITGTNAINLTVTRSGLRAGLFSGTVKTDSQAKSAKMIRGAVLQNQQIGLGSFINTNQSGRVLLMEQ